MATVTEISVTQEAHAWQKLHSFVYVVIQIIFIITTRIILIQRLLILVKSFTYR